MRLIQEPILDNNALASDLLHKMQEGEHFFSRHIQNLLQLVRQQLNMEVAFISEFVDGYRVFRHIESISSFNLIQVGDSNPLDESYCQSVVNGQLPELIKNAQALPQAFKFKATKEVPVGAHISVPLKLSNGHVYGTFCTFSRTSKKFLTKRDLALVRVFASIASVAIEDNIDKHNIFDQRRRHYLNLLDQQKLQFYMQSIVNIRTNKIIGFELLFRNLEAINIPPTQTLHEIEELGLMNQLYENQFSHIEKLLQQVPENMFLSWNIAPNIIRNTNLLQTLTAHNLNRLVLEISEHDAIENYEEIQRYLDPLIKQGARIAIDDAGAGFASLLHILKLKPYYIKIDYSLIHNIHKEKELQALAKGLVSFADACNFTLIAEGIELPEELNSLQELHFECWQGYYFAKPKPIQQVLAESA